MKIRILGFELYLKNDAVTLQRLIEEIQAKGKQQIADLDKIIANPGNISSLDRIIVISKKGDYWIGVTIKIKDVKSFCKLTNSSGVIELTSQDLEGNDRIVDVNFFVINKKTGKGLYQHYHQSTWVNSFCKILQFRHREICESSKALINKKAEVENWSPKKTKKELSRFNSGLTYGIIPKPGDFPEFVRQMELVRKIQFEYKTEPESYSPMQALRKEAKRVSHIFSFGSRAKQAADQIRNRIAKAAENGQFKRARVEGIDPSNVEVVYNLDKNYDYFSEYDYDEAIKDADLKFSNIIESLDNSPMIGRILNLTKRKEIKALLESM